MDEQQRGPSPKLVDCDPRPWHAFRFYRDVPANGFRKAMWYGRLFGHVIVWQLNKWLCLHSAALCHGCTSAEPAIVQAKSRSHRSRQMLHGNGPPHRQSTLADYMMKFMMKKEGTIRKNRAAQTARRQ